MLATICSTGISEPMVAKHSVISGLRGIWSADCDTPLFLDSVDYTGLT